ncbi:serine/threonine-protein kinase ATG1 [Kwoniella shandongensis]|uniref:Serine/threonine-protein kinase ATG1 n=1 Tax=Kwoniella shandongensis TaxID=1734106 RepID=A0A5M6BSS6_9TREE|nr:serine/threonine-protein kinase ATG1 [Kwoniella shandongensis]KAA5525072.1 serine/threonine-protein kinase ATG1 [Kwoniella shandongensis]
MPDSNSQPPRGDKERDRERETGHSSSSRHHKERIGNYVVGAEIGRGSFATVYKGYRSKTKAPIAIKAVSRQKLTTKLLENLESEINILKVIHHRNIVALEDCFKNDTHIYLVMEFCSGSDLSIYIKQRGKLPTLDFVPRPGSSLAKIKPNDEGKIFWPHPASGGLDEKVIRSFLGQLALAIQFLRAENLMHRDIKPQNLLLQPATEAEVAEGHPYGIPVLKVADFGFARILPAAAMAETLCGSPLYMAPEILHYEKYDAKADLWSVGAVLFEMAVGRPPFRANNHVELLRRIEKGQDVIKFPDESSKDAHTDSGRSTPIPVVPVSPDIKALIRALLKRKAIDRMGFEEFFNCGVWDGHMVESTEEEGTLSLEASTNSSANLDASDGRIRRMVASVERSKERLRPTRAPQPIATDAALNPQPAPRPVGQSSPQPSQIRAPQPPQPIRQAPTRRSEPKYYVGDEKPPTPDPTPTPPPTSAPQTTVRANPRPIITSAQRRVSSREKDQGSLDETEPLTPPYNGPTPSLPRTTTRGVGEGSPLAAAPPITMRHDAKDESALEGSESIVGTDYVVVEKQTVEINALADELDQAATKPKMLVRRRSSRASVVTRPVSAFKPISGSPQPSDNAVVPVSYSPPFALSSTPPFAIPQAARRSSNSAITRPPSIPQSLNTIFPPTTVPASYGQDAAARFGISPSSLQTGALARVLTTTAIRLIGTSANSAATAIARAAAKRRPTIVRTGDIDPKEDELLRSVEEIARKAFVLFELADERLTAQEHLAHTARTATPPAGLTGTTPPFSAQAAVATTRRKSSSSSLNNEVWILRQQEAAATDAVVLYVRALAFIAQAMDKVKRYWKDRRDQYDEYVASQELNEMGQWLRARFNEVYEKAEWAKTRSSDSMLFPDWLVHDKARDMSRQAAVAELQGDLVTAEQGYETSVWLLQALLDESVYENGRIRDDDRATYERLMTPIKTRLEALKKKLADSNAAAPVKSEVS